MVELSGLGMFLFRCLTNSNKEITEITTTAIATKAKVTVRSVEMRVGGEVGPMFGNVGVGADVGIGDGAGVAVGEGVGVLAGRTVNPLCQSPG
jgi:hypothetical protein